MDRSDHGLRGLTASEVAAVDALLLRCSFPPAGTEVTVAVSGGPDSMALLVLASAAGLIVTAVHVDHGLRPGSDAEAALVGAAAERFGARFRAERVSIPPGGDLEARARDARQQATGPGALTGHTADDQAETVLINLLRGAGPRGLGAMRHGGIHPLLGLRREETRSLCASLGLETIDDPMNTDPRFLRVRVRHELLPLIAELSQRDPVPLLIRAADSSRQLADFVDDLARGVDPTDAAAIRELARPVADAALRRWLTDDRGRPPSRAELDRIWRVVVGEVVACEISGGRRVARTAGRLRVEPPSA